MKKTLFLICLLCACMYASASSENKLDRDKEEDRSLSDPVKVEVQENLLMLYFVKAPGDVSIQMMDENGCLVYEEALSVLSPQCYYVPIMDKGSYTLVILGDRIDWSVPISL